MRARVMTPRTDVDWIDLEDDETVIRQTLMDSPHSRLPVADGDPDNVLGVVQSRDLLAAMLAGKPLDIRAHLKRAPVVPDTIDRSESPCAHDVARRRGPDGSRS